MRKKVDPQTAVTDTRSRVASRAAGSGLRDALDGGPGECVLADRAGPSGGGRRAGRPVRR
ncbi:hypothetical protein GCM10027517_06630 [Phycicoccus ginsengisoli]